MTSSNDAAIHKTLQKGPASVAEIAKATKMTKAEVEVEMETWYIQRLWVEPVEGKTERWALTDVGRSYFDAYGSEGGSTDGSIVFGEYNRSDGTEP